MTKFVTIFLVAKRNSQIIGGKFAPYSSNKDGNFYAITGDTNGVTSYEI